LVNQVAPIAKEIAVPVAKEALTSYMKGSGIKKPTRRNTNDKRIDEKTSWINIARSIKIY
jgi:hypothetical protein